MASSSPLPAVVLVCRLIIGLAAAAMAVLGTRGADVPPARRPLAETVREWMAQNGAPGVAVVVREQGRTTVTTFGEADVAGHRAVTADSLFELASITKVFTTTLLALALDRGEMSLDDPIVRWLPELAGGGDIAKVTLRQLATHTSGLPRAPGPQLWHPAGRAYTREEFYRYLRAWRADQPPGTRHEYSNIGLGLIGLALEARAKKPFEALLAAEVLGPLGMTSSAVRLTPALRERLVQGYGPDKSLPVARTMPTAWPASGALCASAEDLGRFLAANLGEGDTPAPLRAAMHRAQQGEFKVSDRFTQALAWQVFRAEGTTIVDKNGVFVGSSTYIGMVPEKHLGLVILVNRGKRPATILGRQLLVQLAGAALPVSGGEAGAVDGDPVP